MSQHDLDRWDTKYRTRAPSCVVEPDPLLHSLAYLAEPGRALDLAAGVGDNAVHLARRGWRVTAVDGSAAGLELARHKATACGVEVDWVQADLDDYAVQGRYDLITMFFYLDRDLLRRLPVHLFPGGRLIIKTFNRDQLLSRPGFNPAYLLGSGELPTLFPGLEILAHEESPPDAPGASYMVCRKPGTEANA